MNLEFNDYFSSLRLEKKYFEYIPLSPHAMLAARRRELEGALTIAVMAGAECAFSVPMGVA